MKAGDQIWFMDSKTKRKAVVKRMTSDDVLIAFENGGGIRISRSRIFESEEEIDEYIKNEAAKEKIMFQQDNSRRRKNQYDYML